MKVFKLTKIYLSLIRKEILASVILSILTFSLLFLLPDRDILFQEDGRYCILQNSVYILAILLMVTSSFKLSLFIKEKNSFWHLPVTTSSIALSFVLTLLIAAGVYSLSLNLAVSPLTRVFEIADRGSGYTERDIRLARNPEECIDNLGIQVQSIYLIKSLIDPLEVRYYIRRYKMSENATALDVYTRIVGRWKAEQKYRKSVYEQLDLSNYRSLNDFSAGCFYTFFNAGVWGLVLSTVILSAESFAGIASAATGGLILFSVLQRSQFILTSFTDSYNPFQIFINPDTSYWHLSKICFFHDIPWQYYSFHLPGLVLVFFLFLCGLIHRKRHNLKSFRIPVEKMEAELKRPLLIHFFKPDSLLKYELIKLSNSFVAAVLICLMILLSAMLYPMTIYITSYSKYFFLAQLLVTSLVSLALGSMLLSLQSDRAGKRRFISDFTMSLPIMQEQILSTRFRSALVYLLLPLLTAWIVILGFGGKLDLIIFTKSLVLFPLLAFSLYYFVTVLLSVKPENSCWNYFKPVYLGLIILPVLCHDPSDATGRYDIFLALEFLCTVWLFYLTRKLTGARMI
ncbi:MAG: hypothetical protein PHW04_17910 [Candidatus Wallbacteria bacterium]|nr:hypothetical protein [Candidatus Wallbacteria bacterium]